MRFPILFVEFHQVLSSALTRYGDCSSCCSSVATPRPRPSPLPLIRLISRCAAVIHHRFDGRMWKEPRIGLLAQSLATRARPVCTEYASKPERMSSSNSHLMKCYRFTMPVVLFSQTILSSGCRMVPDCTSRCRHNPLATVARCWSRRSVQKQCSYGSEDRSTSNGESLSHCQDLRSEGLTGPNGRLLQFCAQVVTKQTLA